LQTHAGVSSDTIQPALREVLIMSRLLLVVFVVGFSVVTSGQSPSQPPVQGQILNDWIQGSDARMEGRIMHFRDFAMTLDSRQLRADEASYNMDTGRLELRGNVFLTLPSGPAGFFKINSR
jgi:hypothetical protein